MIHAPWTRRLKEDVDQTVLKAAEVACICLLLESESELVLLGLWITGFRVL